jgi:hypothetical protein
MLPGWNFRGTTLNSNSASKRGLVFALSSFILWV